MIQLYELNSNGIYFRFSGGDEVQTETYTWMSGITVEKDGDNRMTFVDTTGELSGSLGYIPSNAVSRLYITEYTWNEVTKEIVEATRHLWEMTYTSNDITTFYKLSIPEEQLEDAKKLIADGIVQLFEIKLKNGSYIWLKNDNTASWGGRTWTGIPLSFEGYSSAQNDSYSRPAMNIANPDGSFSTFVRDGFLTRASVTRYLVLYDDFINNRNVYQKRTWIIWRVNSLNKQYIGLELRNPMDGVNFDVPARRYIPPEFPFVEM